MTPEGYILNDILNYLKSLKSLGLPLMYERRSAGGFNYKKGISDIYAVFNGRHIEIEVKRPDGQQSVMQEKWESICKSINIPYILTNDIDDFKQKFLKLIESYI